VITNPLVGYKFNDVILPKIVGRKILVTGGASFIGSHLVERIVELGADVIVIDDLSSGKAEFLKAVKNQIGFISDDVRNIEKYGDILKNLDGVFHLAAVHGGRGFIEKYPFDCAQNVGLDSIVFNFASKAGASWITTASSACAYPTQLQLEGDKNLLSETLIEWENPKDISPDGAYGWSKLYSEILLNSASKQYGITGTACRIFTAYGPRENESHAAVALLLKGMLKLDPYPIWGNGKQTRNFTYVGDTVNGLISTLAFQSGMNSLNCGTSDFIQVNDFANAIFNEIGWSPMKINYELDKPTGVASRASNNNRIKELVDWQPNISIQEGVKKMLEYWVPILKSDLEYNRDSLIGRLFSR
jgi:nucleoside-diphosphate-sugar epimerase